MLWQTITLLGLQSETDADIAAALRPLTAQDIPVADVRTLLRERGLWLKDPITRARSFGTIGEAMQQPGFPPELYGALVALEAALYDQSAGHLSTATRPAIAAQVSATVAGLQSVGALNVEDVTAFYSLGGGLQFPQGIGADDVVAARTAYNERTARDDASIALKQRYDELWNEHISEAVLAGDAGQAAAGLRVVADELENTVS